MLQAGPCVITQLKTMAKDGYEAAQIGLVEFVKSSKVNKPMAGHFAKNSAQPVKLMREVAIEAAGPAKVQAGTDGADGEQNDGSKDGASQKR